MYSKYLFHCVFVRSNILTCVRTFQFVFAGNEFIGEHFEQMRLSMAANSTLTSLDMRRNPGYDAGMLYWFCWFVCCLSLLRRLC